MLLMFYYNAHLKISILSVFLNVFENITKDLLKKLGNKIEAQVQLWLPYVTIKDVEINTDRVDYNELRIEIDYVIFENDFDLQSITVFA